MDPEAVEDTPEPESEIKLARASADEKMDQIKRLLKFQADHAAETEQALARLQAVAIEQGNVFAELMQTVRVASLGQITHALYEVGGQYRRSM